MTKINYGVTANNEAAIKEVLGVEALEINENKKVAIDFESEVSEDKAQIGIKFTDSVSAVVTVSKEVPEGYSVLSIKTYNYKLSNGEEFSAESLYDLSLTSIAMKIFTKFLAPLKVKNTPVRNTVAKVNREKLKEEIAKYKAMKAGKTVESNDNAEVTEDADY